MMNESIPISRRRFHAVAGSAVAMTAASALAQPPQSEPARPSVEAAAKSAPPGTIKCFCCDLNWVRPGPAFPAAAQDWAFVDPHTWKTWYGRGCDLFAYAWGAPPDFRPLPVYDEGLKVVREAFRAIP